jgi:hypothetical protein
MDTLIIVAIGVLIVLAIIIALIMLRCSWGDFPSRSSLPPAPPPQALSTRMSSNTIDSSPVFDEMPGGPAGGLVPITNPHIRRAAEQALRQNDQAARYFMRDGEQIYFNTDAIADPQERQTAYRVMQRLGTDERIDMRDIQQVLQIMRRE